MLCLKVGKPEAKRERYKIKQRNGEVMVNTEQIKQVDFYLGANTPSGFYSYFAQLEKPDKYHKLFLIKGGAGSGKSSMMKKVMESTAKKSKIVEKIHCSSDTDSLDGVILNGLKVAIVDATRPHVIEPKYHGAFETTVNICEALNNKVIYQNREDIIKVSDEISKKHRLCCDFLRASAHLANSNVNLYSQYVNYEKLDNYISRLLAYEIKEDKRIKNVDCGNEDIRLLSAVTNQGVVTFENTVTTLASRIYMIEDMVGCVSSYIIKRVRDRAVSLGYDVYTCPCAISLHPMEKLEHVIIPKLGLAFITSNKYTKFESITPTKKINSRRFENKERRGAVQYIMAFNAKQSGVLLDMAITMLAKAKAQHDVLEGYYIPNVDFSIVDKLTQQVIDDINTILP